MMHRAWSSIEEVPYCFSRSYVKFQGHTALKIVDFDPNWAFADCNSSLESPMATKWCTELKTAKKRCPIVFQGHPSNSKVTRDKTSQILTQIGRFRTIGRSQLSNLSDLPCFTQKCIIQIWVEGFQHVAYQSIDLTHSYVVFPLHFPAPNLILVYCWITHISIMLISYELYIKSVLHYHCSEQSWLKVNGDSRKRAR